MINGTSVHQFKYNQPFVSQLLQVRLGPKDIHWGITSGSLLDTGSQVLNIMHNFCQINQLDIHKC